MGEPPSSCLSQLTFMELPLGSSSPSTLGGFGFPAATYEQDGAELEASVQGGKEDKVILLCNYCVKGFITRQTIEEINLQPRTN